MLIAMQRQLENIIITFQSLKSYLLARTELLFAKIFLDCNKRLKCDAWLDSNEIRLSWRGLIVFKFYNIRKLLFVQESNIFKSSSTERYLGMIISLFSALGSDTQESAFPCGQAHFFFT